MRRLTVLLLLVAVAQAGCGSDKKDSGGSKNAGGAAAGKNAPARSANGCEIAKAPAAKSDAGASKPDGGLDKAGVYRLKITTNCGSFTIKLDQHQSPNAAASIVSLARNHFFDGTVFHRIVPDFVIQGGDPTGTGRGGPGYSTHDKVPSDAQYTKGVVAMAKAPQEPAGTAGSQFYVVTGLDAGLPPDYAIVGTVVEGQDVVDRIGRLGDPNTEKPTRVVVIRSATVEEVRNTHS